jgi:hypothetical protein
MDNEGFEFIDGEDFQSVADVLEDLVDSGSEWSNLLDVCLLASAYCAQQDGMTTDEFMEIISSVRVSPEGIYGEA